MDILLISQVRLLRDALVAALQGVHGNQACGASSRDTVEAALAASAPAVVVVDAAHPEGAALVAAVRAHAPTASVVVLAAGGRDEEFLAWADVGISGYLGLDASAYDKQFYGPAFQLLDDPGACDRIGPRAKPLIARLKAMGGGTTPLSRSQ